jgi:hypothetical protein
VQFYRIIVNMSLNLLDVFVRVCAVQKPV